MFTLYPYQQKMLDEFTKGEFDCLICKKKFQKQNGKIRLFLTWGRSGLGRWIWYCVKCYDKTFRKLATDTKISQASNDSI